MLPFYGRKEKRCCLFREKYLIQAKRLNKNTGRHRRETVAMTFRTVSLPLNKKLNPSRTNGRTNSTALKHKPSWLPGKPRTGTPTPSGQSAAAAPRKAELDQKNKHKNTEVSSGSGPTAARGPTRKPSEPNRPLRVGNLEH